MSLLAFSPSTSITVAVTTAQSQGIVAGTGHYIRIVNGGQGQAWVLFYEANQAVPTVPAAGAAMLILAGAIEVFSVASDTTRVAIVGDAAGTSLNLTRGEGQ